MLCFTAFCPSDPQAELVTEERSERDFTMGKQVTRPPTGKVDCFPRCLRRTHDASAREWALSSGPHQRPRPPASHLHHQHDGVQGDHGHDGVLEGRGHHEVPDAVLEGVPVLRHVAGERLGADGEVDARPLWEGHGGGLAHAQVPSTLHRRLRQLCRGGHSCTGSRDRTDRTAGERPP